MFDTLKLLNHFITMGGYGYYIWPAYGVVFMVLFLNFIIPWRRIRHLQRQQLIEVEKANTNGVDDASNS